ncbi:hypothetical protein ACIQXW_06515 [Lysinibacillus sp. NPDC097162]|uniref:hypothetical protein n=1 Tax=Lysinibacillus sp. NPDC097162 TaxID=3364140 RepID=UPI0038209273
MKVFLEFHEHDKLINTKDFDMNNEQITALLNAKTVLWPFDERGKNAIGKLYESHYNPFNDTLLVRVREVVESEEERFSFK